MSLQSRLSEAMYEAHLGSFIGVDEETEFSGV